MMMTSNFTLEYSCLDDPERFTAAFELVPNLPRTPMPVQLDRLGVPEPVWTNIYDRSNGVVDRAVQREKNKRELDRWLLYQKGTKHHKEEVKAKVQRDKENHDANTSKGWTNLMNECKNELGVYGVSTNLLANVKADGVIFGINFQCDALRLHPNKLKLQYCHRTGLWSWIRDKVPAELASLHVDNKTWSSVWDRAKRTHAATCTLESHLDTARVNLARQMASEPGSYTAKCKKALEEVSRLERTIESKWGQLLEFAEDAFYLWGISASLCYDDESSQTKYCGIILRFKPVVSTVPVISETTIAMPLPSAPATEDTTDMAIESTGLLNE